MQRVDDAITRRRILQRLFTFSATVLLPGFISACSDTNLKKQTVLPQTGGNCLANGTTVTMGGNHGHVLTVPIADIAAGAAKVYDITGTAGHSHTVSFAASDFATLVGNTGVLLVSSLGAGHTHDITVNCA